MSRILDSLLDMQRFGQGQGNQLFDTGLGRLGQAVQFDAEDASRRRQQASQRRLEIEARKAQVHQANKARQDSWTKFGIQAAGSAAGGAMIGSMAAGAAPTVSGINEGMGVAGESAINPATEMSAIQGAAGENPLNMSAINYGMDTTVPARMATGEIPTAAAAPASTAFAGGSRGMGALYGAGLGLAGGVSGQNFLGPAIDMPYENAVANARIANTGMDAALTNARIGTEQARAGYYDRGHQPESSPLTAEEQARAARIKAGLVPRASSAQTPTTQPAFRLGEGGVVTGATVPAGGDVAYAQNVMDTSSAGRAKPTRLGNTELERTLDALVGAGAMTPEGRNQILTQRAQRLAKGGGNGPKQMSDAYLDVESRIGDASSQDDALKILEHAFTSEKRLTAPEYKDLKGRILKRKITAPNG